MVKIIEATGVKAIAVHGRFALFRFSDSLLLIEILSYIYIYGHAMKIKLFSFVFRQRCQRSSQPCNYDFIRAVSEAVSIPVIANGGSLDIKQFEDIEIFRKRSGCASVMLARIAQWNPSIFRKEGFLPQSTEIRDYLKQSIDYDNNFPSTKYCICQLMHKSMETKDGKLLSASKTMKELWYEILKLNFPF